VVGGENATKRVRGPKRKMEEKEKRYDRQVGEDYLAHPYNPCPISDHLWTRY
jgi:hypothetical protein